MMLRFFDKANLVTLCGLACATLVVVMAAAGHHPYAFAALVVAGLCDFVDGAIARRLKRDQAGQQFGAALDSAVDAASFAMAPVALLYAIGLRSPLEVALLMVFAWAGVWRLAYFSSVGLSTSPKDAPKGDSQTKYYTGLPITYVALIFPLVGLLGFVDRGLMRMACTVATAVLAIAMVAPIQIPKPSGPWYLRFFIIAVVLVLVYLLGARFFLGVLGDIAVA